jgi:hypothetical protein
MPSAHVSISPSAATPPLFPHDPPDAVPQAEAWRRALRVVGYMPPKEFRAVRTTVVRTTARKDKHAHRRV